MSTNPFNRDAASDIANTLKFQARGDAGIQQFVDGGSGQTWDTPTKTVICGRKGEGKSHLILKRSDKHRSSKSASHTWFYPHETTFADRRPKEQLVEELTQSIGGVIPHWLVTNREIRLWEEIWKICLLGQALETCDAVKSKQTRALFEEVFLGENVDTNSPENQVDQLPANRTINQKLHRLLSKLCAFTFEDGSELLENYCSRIENDWSEVIYQQTRENKNKRMIAIYLDSPDEMVGSAHNTIGWAILQQGLLVAIWRLQKGNLSNNLRVYVSLRSEAFEIQAKGNLLAQASVVRLDLSYSDFDLRQILSDRILDLNIDKLKIPEKLEVNPIEAFFGAELVSHSDRHYRGEQLKEGIWEATLRHTRRTPRELIGIADALFRVSRNDRDVRKIRSVVNRLAKEECNAVISDMQDAHGLARESVLSKLTSEVVLGNKLRKDCTTRQMIEVLNMLLIAGLIGYSLTLEDSAGYTQNFSHSTSGGVYLHNEADYYFVHPIFKEWIVYEWWPQDGRLIPQSDNDSSASKRFRKTVDVNSNTRALKFTRCEFTLIGAGNVFIVPPPLEILCNEGGVKMIASNDISGTSADLDARERQDIRFGLALTLFFLKNSSAAEIAADQYRTLAINIKTFFQVEESVFLADLAAYTEFSHAEKKHFFKKELVKSKIKSFHQYCASQSRSNVIDGLLSLTRKNTISINREILRKIHLEKEAIEAVKKSSF